METLLFIGGLLFITAAKITAGYLAKKGMDKDSFGRIEGSN